MKSICLIILSVFSANVLAGSVSVPNTFQPNTPAVSGQVNANFDVLVVAVNAMQAQIDAQAMTIAQLQSDLATAQGQITALESNSVLALDGFLSLGVHNGLDVARFDAINVQITNGLGATNGDPGALNPLDAGPVNGLGNLIIGYDDVDFIFIWYNLD